MNHAVEAFCASGTSPTRAPQALPDHVLLGPDDAPCVLLLGGISAPAEPSWWSHLLGPGAPLDTQRLRVLSLPHTAPTPAEQAERILDLLDHHGLPSLSAAIGCSYGGLVCLALAEAAPHRVDRLVLVATAHRSHGLARAWRSVQREILAWGLAHGVPDEGVALARKLAMTTYRTDRELDARFDPASLQAWLDHHGRRYAETVSPVRYAQLSEALDTTEFSPETLGCPVDLIGFTSDQLVPPWLLEELHALLPDPGSLHLLPSAHGHDGFLLEQEALAGPLAAALRGAA